MGSVLSYLIYLEQDVMYKMTCTICRVQDDMYNISCTRCHVQYVVYKMTCTRWHVQYVVYKMSCTICCIQDDMYIWDGSMGSQWRHTEHMSQHQPLYCSYKHIIFISCVFISYNIHTLVSCILLLMCPEFWIKAGLWWSVKKPSLNLKFI